MQSILVHKIDHIGDTLLATPAIRSLRISFPNATITALATPLTKAVLEGNPDLNEIVLFDPKGVHKTKEKMAAFTREISARQYDLIVCFSAATEDYRMVKRFGGKVRLAPVYQNMLSAKLISLWTITQRIMIEDDPGKFMESPYPLRHEVEQNLEVVKAIGAEDPPENKLFLYVAEEDKQWAEEKFSSLILPTKSSKVVGVQLSDRWFWPPYQVQGVANLLATLTKFYPTGYFLIFHDQPQMSMAAELQNLHLGSNMEFVSYLPLKRYAALMGKCNAMVTMHSGTTHIAAAMNVPTVAVFRAKWFEYFSVREAPWKIPHMIVRKPWDPPIPQEISQESLESAIGLHSRDIVDRLQTLVINQGGY